MENKFKDIMKILNNNFNIILGGRSNGKKAFLESLGYKVITYTKKGNIQNGK